MHGLQGQAGFGVGPAGGQIQDASAADRGELVPVTDQRDPGVVFVGDDQQGPGAVLVEHPGLVDQQQVTGLQHRGRCGPV